MWGEGKEQRGRETMEGFCVEMSPGKGLSVPPSLAWQGAWCPRLGAPGLPRDRNSYVMPPDFFFFLDTGFLHLPITGEMISTRQGDCRD